MRKFGLGHFALWAALAALAACGDSQSGATSPAAAGSSTSSAPTGTSTGTPLGAPAGTTTGGGNGATSTTAVSAAVNGAIEMSAANYSIKESAGSVTLTARRTGGTRGALSVQYATISGTAVAGLQFTDQNGLLTWADGDAANKSLQVPVSSQPFTGTKSFSIQLTAVAETILGSYARASVDIVGDDVAAVTKSIRQWVTCDENTDETAQLEQAIQLAANGAFTLIIDCPVRLHTGSEMSRSITVPDGVTIQFDGAGELLGVHSGAPALSVPHPPEVTFINWNYTYL